MRALTMLAAAAGALALGACGGAQQDDPANLPRLGDWEISRIAVGLRQNGASVSRDERTDVYVDSGVSPADTRNACTEPKLADKEWLAQHISRQLDRTCTITDAMQSGAAAQGNGICGEARRGDSRRAETSFHYYADVTPVSFKADVQVSIRAEMAGGGSDTTGMTVKIEGVRKGECGSKGRRGTFGEG